VSVYTKFLALKIAESHEICLNMRYGIPRNTEETEVKKTYGILLTPNYNITSEEKNDQKKEITEFYSFAVKKSKS
jgi:hypothetical protein